MQVWGAHGTRKNLLFLHWVSSHVHLETVRFDYCCSTNLTSEVNLGGMATAKNLDGQLSQTLHVPWEPTTFIFRGYNPYIGGLKPSLFMVLGSKGMVYSPYIYPLTKCRYSIRSTTYWVSGKTRTFRKVLTFMKIMVKTQTKIHLPSWQRQPLQYRVHL